MRKLMLALAATFALFVGVGLGLTPTDAKADPPDPDCYVKCKNGIEYVCCPRRLPACITTGTC